MRTDAQQIRTEFDEALAGLPSFKTVLDQQNADADLDRSTVGTVDIEAIDAAGRRLEQAHQILVDALESVEKG